jgi:small subunit ribosomal protein S6
MNHYETVFILTPVLSEPQMKEAVEKFKGVLTDNGAAIVNEENWGLRKLAYPIQKTSTGFYTLIEFDAEPTIVKILETAFRRDEKVLRFLTFHLDKFAEEYAIKRRSLKKNAPKAEEAPVVEEAPVAETQEVVEEVVENNND